MIFFENIFNAGVKVQPIKDADGMAVYRMQEAKYSASYVDLKIDDGMVVSCDSNLKYDSVFSSCYGMRKCNDYLVVNNCTECVEVFSIELKSHCNDFDRAKRQIQAGIALLAFCHRSRLDQNKAFPANGIKYYGGVLTNTVIERGSTDPAIQDARLKVRRFLTSRPGVICVNGHDITLERLRTECEVVHLEDGIRNLFSAFPVRPLPDCFRQCGA